MARIAENGRFLPPAAIILVPTAENAPSGELRGLTPHQQRDWYRETGSGMGTTLNLAAEMGAYTLTDRATWLTFGNKRNLVVLFEGDTALFNQYGIVIINPNAHPRVKAKLSQRFTDWILGSKGQNAIAGFTVRGTQLFFPNARRQ